MRTDVVIREGSTIHERKKTLQAESRFADMADEGWNE